jgi:metal-responsive CopG/Arc/MetJ family transcriptional regulator
MAEAPAKKEDKYRVQLDFSEEALHELNDLQKKLHASSRAEVVRNALGVLRWVTNHLNAGDKIIVEKANGTKSDVEFPFLLL